MINRLRTIWLIASFDFMESLRSRKALGLLFLYLAGALAASGVFIRVLHAMEKVAAAQLRVAQTEGTGAMTGELLKSEQLLDTLDELIGDRPLAESLLSMPPLALFYGWLALTFMPLLVTLTACDSVSSEVSSGSCRFALFRADKSSWVLGKLGGQAALMTAGILLGALGSFLLGWWFLSDYHPLRVGYWMLRFSGRAWLYGFAYLGLAMGASQLTRSVNWSRMFALVGLFAFGLLGNLLEIEWITERAPTLASTASMLFPQGHDLDLWRPTLMERLPALVMLPTLGLAYFAIGYLRFSRRDR